MTDEDQGMTVHQTWTVMYSANGNDDTVIEVKAHVPPVQILPRNLCLPEKNKSKTVVNWQPTGLQ